MITLNAVKFGYTKGATIFNNLNLTLQSGGIYGLLGKNGAGKSSLLKLIAGLLFPNTGTIEVLGISELRSKSLLQEIYLLSEDGAKLNLVGIEYLTLYSQGKRI